MIPRYALPAMSGLFEDRNRYATWARVEVLASEAQARLGQVPPEAVDDIRRAPVPSPDRVAEFESERDHEVLAFLAAFCETMPPESARWVHFGMTSYDLVDTAYGYTLAQASDELIRRTRRLRAVLAQRADEHWTTPCVGRTHGVHAEPTTFGHKLAGFAFAIERCLGRLRAAREAVAVGTISGAVGTYALIDPSVERAVCAQLGLGVEPVPSQVVARDRHAQLVQAVATLGSCVEQIALELRLLQRTEVCEVAERRTAGYQGSSAMPHKNNPTASERLCGLARLLRGYASATLENVALWHERDLAHSSVERVAVADALIAGHYQVTMAEDLIAGLTVFPERMRANLDHTKGLVFSSAVFADLLRDGMERETAYRTVQAAANRTTDNHQEFGAALRDAGVTQHATSVDRFLVNHELIRGRLEQLRELED